MHKPDIYSFRDKAKRGNLIPVYRELLADTLTPVSAFMKVDTGGYSFLLESVQGGEKWARYSFLGADPSVIVWSEGGTAYVKKAGETTSHPVEGDPLVFLKSVMSEYKPVELDGMPRFSGGAIGYIGYDVISSFEDIPLRDRPGTGCPDIFFMITDTLLVFDNVAQKIKVMANAHVGEAGPDAAYAEAVEKIDRLVERLTARPPRRRAVKPRIGTTLRSNFKKKNFEKAVLKAKEYIKAGDIFQVVLSQRFEKAAKLDPFDVYRSLRVINPSPYMFFLRCGDFTLAGSSPEVMVRLEDGKIDLRPIAGTRKRGATEEEDEALMKELLADPKELAEHLMLIDLGRNDVGRVSRPGGVVVNELMVIEKYSHVMHIVSNVRGEVAEGTDAFDVMRACFPAGTVSGAPKIRAMQIIDELEPTLRGPYAGTVGFFGFTGSMDSCITIRTLMFKDGKVYVQAGAGIVADSDPEKEYQETVNKAAGMMKALEMAEKGLL
ncbi:MAG: anthranilate synthase component I [Nitrospirae bacterium]|nr:anthranilate synthase component I [Nitrospirota bacterium]MBI5695796.1 anthranilate synthase component I [Nitrospirota bacterium]